LEIADGQPPQVAPPQHQNPDAPSWHRELVLGAVDDAAADEAAPTLDNTEGQGDRCRLSGVAQGAAMTAAQSHAARQLDLLAVRALELADRVAAGQLGFIDAVDLSYEAAVWAGLRETVGDDLIQATLAAAFAGARRPT
jgi:hypothetical protein